MHSQNNDTPKVWHKGLIVQLEPRLMYDGAAGVAAVDAMDSASNSDAPDTLHDATDSHVPAVTEQGPAETSDTGPEVATILEALETSPEIRCEIAFVDASVQDADTLIAGLDPSMEVYQLNATESGLSQMADILANRQGVDAIHVFSHGSSGEITLGSENINGDNAETMGDDFATIGQAMDADGDILIYGCNVGQDSAFVDQIADLTGADVATSDDATGASELGGDWELETQVGTVDTDSLDISGFQNLLVVNTTDAAPVLSLSEDSSAWNTTESAIFVDSGLTVTDTDGGNIDGATVSIENMATGDTLSCTSSDGVAGSFDSGTGVLTLTGSASADAYQTVLRSVTFSNSNDTPDTTTRNIAITLGSALSYNDHYYEYVSDRVTWSEAESAASNKTYYGLEGYLTTVTSAGENAFIASKLEGMGWMGASDAAQEGMWRWVTGPEGEEDSGAGRYFFQQTGSSTSQATYGNTTPGGGYAIEGLYNNWASLEPNDWGSSGEDYAHFYLSAGATWNDYPTNINVGYVVEYGGMDGDPDLQLSATKSVLVQTAPVNAAPEISSGSVSINLDETDISLGTSGILTVTDVDTTDVVTADSALSVSGTSDRSDTAAPTDAELLDMFSISPTNILDDTDTSATLNWDFNSGTETFDYLAADETIVLTYTVQATDNADTPLSDTETVTITITGANDVPVISLGQTDSAAAELTETDGTLTSDGRLSIEDLDRTDVVNITEAVATTQLDAAGNAMVSDGNEPDNAALLEMFAATLQPIDATAQEGTITWDFDSTNEAFNYLAQGEQLVLTYTLTATDSQNATDTQDVTVTITGTNDTPVIIDINAPENTEPIIDGYGGYSFLTAYTGELSTNDSLNPDRAGCYWDKYILSNVANGSDVAVYMGNSAFDDYLQIERNGEVYTANDDGGLPDGSWNASFLNWTYQDGDVIRATTFAQGATGAYDLYFSVDTTLADVTETLTETNTALASNGTLTVTDVDFTDHVTASVDSLAISETSSRDNAAAPTNTELLAMLSVSPTTILQDTQNSASLTWSFDSGSENFNYLAQGEQLVLNYTLMVSDSQSATDSQNILITINGTNDVPVVTVDQGDNDSASLTETDAGLTSTGTLSIGDLDRSDVVNITEAVATAQLDADGNATAADGNEPDATALLDMFAATLQPIDGTAQEGSITWNFDSSSEAFNYLAEGEQLVLTYTLTATDSQNTTDSQNVTVTITGTNDVPVITLDQGDSDSATLTETDAELTSTGTLSVGDLDRTDVVNITEAVAASQLNASGNTVTSDVNEPDNAALLNMFAATLQPIDGTALEGTIIWDFDSANEAFNYLAEGEKLVLTYTLTATDSQNTTDTQDVTVTITGTNDVPVITLDQGDSDSATITEADAGLTSAGTLSVEDLDQTDVVNITEAVAASQLDASGNTVISDANEPDNAALLDMFAATLQPIDGTAQEGTITWDFDSTNEAFNYLAQGEKLVLTYTLTATDSRNTTDTQNVTVTITGTNDVPVITLDQGDSDSAAITETDAELTSTGSLSVGDLDRTDVVNITEAVAASQLDASGNAVTSDVNEPDNAALLNMFAATLQPIDGTALKGTIIWDFDSANEAFNYLAQGEKLVLTYTLTATDSQNTTDTHDVTITITGTNDAPVFPTVTETDTVDHAGETTETISTFTITESPDETSLAYDENEHYAVGFYVVSPKDSTWVNMRSFYNNEANVTTETYTTQLSESPDVDLLVVYLPNNAFTETEIQIFEGFLDTGGRIFFVGEHQGYAPIPNSNISTAISALGGNISILGGSYADLDISNSASSKNLNNSPLTAGVLDFSPNYHAQLQINSAISQVVMTDDGGRIVMADQALSKGRVTVIADENWLSMGSSTYGLDATNADNDIFLRNLLINSANNIDTVSEGENPNQEFLTPSGIIETDTGLMTSGELSLTDVDTTDTVNVMATSVSAIQKNDMGTIIASSTLQPAQSEFISMVSVLPSTVLDSSLTQGSFTWNFDSGDEAFNYLATGEELVLTYTLTANDGNNGTADQTIEITINGTNDVPIITVDQGDSDSVTLTETDAGLTSTGTLSVEDLDQTDVVNITEAVAASQLDASGNAVTSNANEPDNAALLDMFAATLQPIDATAQEETITWDFDSSNETFNYLAQGEKLVLTYTLTATDSQNTTDTQDVTVTITGTNEVPIITIDQTDSAAANLTETDAGLTSTGTLSVEDLDQTDVVNVTEAVAASQLDASGNAVTSDVNEPDNAALLDMFAATLQPIDATALEGTITWNFDSSNEAFNYLAHGEKLVLTYTLTATDSQNATDTQDVTVTITGTNDVPVITLDQGDSDSANLTETDAELTSTGTLSVGDLDRSDVVNITEAVATSQLDASGNAVTSDANEPDNAALLDMFAATLQPIDGTAQEGTITWDFDSTNEAFNYLAHGEKLVLTYTLTATDSQNTTDTQDVTVTITGTNDVPIITIGQSDSDSAAITETDTGLTSTGTLSIGDLDRTDVVNITEAVAASQLNASGNAVTSDANEPDNAALLDMFAATLQPIDGTAQEGTITWDFDSTNEAFNYLAHGEKLVLTYTLTATDSQNTTDTQDVTVTITGTNDVPIITIGQGDSDSAAITETDAGLTSTGTLSVGDLDTTDLVNITEAVATTQLDAAGNAMVSDGNEPDNAAILDMFAATPQPIDGSAHAGTITWDFNSTNEAFNYLAHGEKLVLTYTLTATDSQNTTDTQDVTVTITGTNEVPIITVGQGDSDSATITETDTGLTSTGTLSVGDLDTTDVVNITEAVATVDQLDADGNDMTSDANEPNTAALLDMFTATLQPIDGTAQEGTITWDFNSTNEAFNYLAQGEKLVLTFTLTATDSQNTTETQNVTITITGTNDAPVLAHPLTAPENGQTLQPFQYDVPIDTFSDADTTDTITYSVTGLPTGLVFSPDTLQITGSPKVSGTFDITIIGTDQQEASTQEVITLIIDPAPAPVAPDTPTPTPSDSQQGDGSSSLSDPAETLFQTTGTSDTGDTQSGDASDSSSQDTGTGSENDGGASDGTESGSSDGGDGSGTTGRETGEGQDTVTSQATVRIDTDGTVQFTDQNNENAAGALEIESLHIDSETGVLELQVRDSSGNSVPNCIASLADGSPLPQWLNFDPLTGTITGTPPANIHKIELVISTTDGGNKSHVLEITINFDNDTQNVSQTPGNDSVTETNDSHIAVRGLQPLSAQFAVIRAQTNDYGQSLMEALA